MDDRNLMPPAFTWSSQTPVPDKWANYAPQHQTKSSLGDMDDKAVQTSVNVPEQTSGKAESKNELRNPHSPSNVKGLWKLFTSDSTIHGVRQVCSPQRSICARVIYGLLLFCGICACVGVATTYLISNYNYNTITTIDVFFSQPIDFPTITLCNISPYAVKRDDPVAYYFNSFYGDTYATGEPSSVLYSTDNVRAQLDNMTYREFKEKYSFKVEDLILLPHFNGEALNHSDFEVVELAGYTCFMFNGPNYTGTHGTRASHNIGRHHGFKAYLNIQQDLYPPSERNAGAQIYISHHKSPPRVDVERIDLAPGTSTSVTLIPQKFSFLPAPYKSYVTEECIEDEDLLEGKVEGNFYTRDMCFYQCFIQQANRECGCHNGGPPVNGLKPCSMLEVFANCHWDVVDRLYREVRQNNASIKCDCPVRCTLYRYIKTISYANFPSKAAAFSIRNMFNITPEELRDNYLEVLVYFETNVIEHTRLEERFKWEDFIGILGGQMGLMLGASFISILEFLEACFETICISLRRLSLAIWTMLSLACKRVRKAGLTRGNTQKTNKQ